MTSGLLEVRVNRAEIEDLSRFFKKNYAASAIAATQSITETTAVILLKGRINIQASGAFSGPWIRGLQSRQYPRGKNSPNAKSYINHRLGGLASVFEFGASIRPKRGRYLWLLAPGAPKRMTLGANFGAGWINKTRGRTTPQRLGAAAGKLEYVVSKRGHPMLGVTAGRGKAVDLSCRKNASIHAPKVIPGGWATGKVTAYTLSWSGMDGRIYADVTLGCSIGAGTSDTAPASGTPTVAGLDALDSSAQHMAGASVVLGPEISYQAPPPDLTYNGFRFPLTREQVVMVSGWNSTALHQLQSFMEQMARPGAAIGFMGLKGAAQRAQLAAAIGLKQYQDPYYYEFWLRPISDQQTETPYVVKVSKLNVPKQINLEA